MLCKYFLFAVAVITISTVQCNLSVDISQGKDTEVVISITSTGFQYCYLFWGTLPEETVMIQVGKQTFRHIFSDIGPYKVRTGCMGADGRQQNFFYFAERISDVKVTSNGFTYIVPVAWPLENDIEVIVTFKGTDVELTETFPHNNSTTKRTIPFNTNIFISKIQKDVFPSSGLYILKYNLHHPNHTYIEEVEVNSVTVYILFFLQEEGNLIKGSSISDTDGVVHFHFEVLPVSDIFYEMTVFSYTGDQKEIVRYCQRKTSHVILSYNHTESKGLKNLTLNIILRVTNLIYTNEFVWQNTVISHSAIKQPECVFGLEVFEDVDTDKLRKEVSTTDIKLIENPDFSSCNAKIQALEFDWRVYPVGATQPPFVYFRRTESPVTVIKANTLDIGLHKCVLKLCVVTLRRKCQEGFMYLEIIAPPLRAVISGTRKRIVRASDGPVILNANKSEDSSAAFPSISIWAVEESWSCITADENVLTESVVDELLANSILSKPSSEDGFYNCSGKIDSVAKTFTLDTNRVVLNRWYMVCYSMTKGNRSAKYCVALKVIYWKVEDISIRCISNCAAGICPYIRNDRLQLDIDIKGTRLNTSLHVYKWHFYTWDTDLKQFIEKPELEVVSDGIGLAIPKSMFEPGQLYMISVDCTVPGMVKTSVGELYTVNTPPYGGNCSVDRINGTAALDLFCVTCVGWKDRVDQSANDSILDDNRCLRYDVIQIVSNDPVVKYTIVPNSVTDRNCFFLNPGRREDYNTLIQVKIKDKCKTSAHWNIAVFVFPPVDTSAIFSLNNTNRTDVLMDFIDEMDKRIETSLDFHNTDKTLNQIRTFFSSLPELQFPETASPFNEYPSKGSGGLPDMYSGTETFVTAQETLKQFLQPDVTTNMTHRIQQVKEKYTTITEQLIRETIKAGVANDAVRLTMFTEILLTIEQSSGTSTNTIKDSVLNTMGDVIKEVKNLLPNDDPEVQITIQELVNLLGKLILSIVPEMKSISGYVTDVKTARQYNDGLFNLATKDEQNRREMAAMTPNERNFFLAKHQERSALLIDQKRVQVLKLIEAMDGLLVAMTETPLCTGCSMNYAHAGTDITLERNKAAVLSQKQFTVGNSTLTMEILDPIQTHPVTVVVSHTTKNPFLSRAGEKNIAAFITSPVLTVTIENVPGVSHGRVEYTHKVETHQYNHVTPSIDEDDASQMVVAKTWKGFEGDFFCVSIKMSPHVSGYWVYVKHGSRPTIIDYDSKQYFSDERKDALCFPTGKAGMLFFGLTTENTESSQNDPPYDIATATMTCLSYSRSKQQWDSDGCISQWIPHQSRIRCSCKNLVDLIFANTFQLAPNKIDLSAIFLKFSPLDQAAVLATLSMTSVIYVLVLIWARRRDKWDEAKWAIRPLVDCDPVDNYYYMIRVYTGMRPRAGTTSKVGFILMGRNIDDTSTTQRELSDGYRKGFPTGSIINLMLSTSQCLGQLEYLRIWHDNSGLGHRASWYLSKVEIIDVQTQEMFVFKADRWLSLDYQHSDISCTLPVSVQERSASLKKRFVSYIQENFHDEHLWLSVLYRPSPNTFTRSQRWSCVIVFLLTTMLADAMFFRVGENYEIPAPMKLGPFEFSLQQVYISGICSLITIPASLLACLFRLINVKPTAQRRKSNFYKINDSSVDPDGDSERVIRNNGEISFVEGYSKMTYRFPSWVANLAWFIVVTAAVTSIFFVFLYSMEWGKQKSEQWLSAFIITFVQSFVCMDTIRVLMVALLFTAVYRRPAGPSIIVHRNNILGQYPACLRLKMFPEQTPVAVLDKKTLNNARLSRENQLAMRKSVIDVFATTILIALLFGISYSNRDDRSYYLHKDIVQKLLRPGSSMSFENITSVNKYFQWMNQTAIPNLFPEKHPDGERLHWRQREFMAGEDSYRMGPPRLRQLRAKKRTCKVPYLGTLECTGGDQASVPDTDDYCVGWKYTPCDPTEKIYKFSSSSWQYTSPSNVWGFPIQGFLAMYNDGGYVSRLDVNRDVSVRILDELFRSLWLDKATRTVIFEFTLYNPNVNMFAYNVFMVEFAETGTAVPFYMILPMRVHQHHGISGQHTLVLEILFLVYLVISVSKAGLAIWKQKLKYFSKFRKCLNFCFLIIGITCIGLYANRLSLAEKALSEFKQDTKQFVNLYKTAFWDLIFVVCLGCLNCIAFLKLFYLLGYTKRIGSVVTTVAYAASRLVWFSVLVVYIYVLFAFLGYLLFGANKKSYMSLYRSLNTLFLSMVHENTFTNIGATATVMSKIYFLSYAFVVLYLLLTMFMCVWIPSIQQARAQSKHGSADEIIQYIISELKAVFGFKLEKNELDQRRNLLKSRRN